MAKNNKKKNMLNKKIINILILVFALALAIYGMCKIIDLAIIPTDMVMIEQDTISEEEDCVRICYKR